MYVCVYVFVCMCVEKDDTPVKAGATGAVKRTSFFLARRTAQFRALAKVQARIVCREHTRQR